MAASRRFSRLPLILALLAAATCFSVLTTHAAPPPEDVTASGGVVPQSGNCSASRPDDEHCLPGGPQDSTQSGGLILPPMPPPVTPPAPPATPVTPPRVPPDFSPEFINGWAHARVRIVNYEEKRNITYESNSVDLAFKKIIDGQEGNTRYLLYGVQMSPGGPVEPLKMTWTASGTVGDCTVKGKTTVTFPTGVDPSQDLTRPSYGQLNVIGPGGGNFHSVMVKAFNPEAKLIMTCPGDPPTVTEEFFEAGYLLHIVWEKNILCDEYLEFWGERSFDLNDPLFAVLLSIPPGPNRSIAIEALQMGGAERNPTHSYYEWSWGLWPGGVMPPENIRQNCRPAP